MHLAAKKLSLVVNGVKYRQKLFHLAVQSVAEVGSER